MSIYIDFKQFWGFIVTDRNTVTKAMAHISSTNSLFYLIILTSLDKLYILILVPLSPCSSPYNVP